MGCQCDDQKPGVPDTLEAVWPGVQSGERDVQDVTHRDADRSPVEGVGARRIPQHARNSERCGIAEEGTDVLVVIESLE